jgi:hypothetical protein
MDVLLRMLPLNNEKGLEKPTDYQEFHEIHVTQVKKARVPES